MEEDKDQFLFRPLWMFAAKAAIFFVSLGLLVQNPAALYKSSEIAEREDKLNSATRDMELAVGLLELHNADKQVVKRYIDRLDKL